MSALTVTALQTAGGLVLISAAIAKLANPNSLLTFLLATGFARHIARSLSILVPGLEAIIGLGLLLGVLGGPRSLVAAIFATTLFVVVLLAYRRGVREGCHCFGALDSDELTAVSVVRSLVLSIAMATLTVYWLADPLASPGLTATTQSTISILVGLMLAAGYILAFALLGQILSFEGKRPRPIPNRHATSVPVEPVRVLKEA